jgi:tRNA(Ser,Leu) C12 N-acetylase TAN1
LKIQGLKLLIIYLFLVSCGKSTDNSFKRIDDKTMAKIVADLQLLEARVSRLNFQGVDSSKVVFNHFQDQIFKKYKTDSANYARSYKFYAERPAEFSQIYDEVIKILESKRDTSKHQI